MTFVSILVLTLLYASDTAIKISEGSEPNVSQNTIQDYYTSENELNLFNDTNFRLAFGWRPYANSHDRLLKYDNQLTRWIARISSMDKEGIITYKDLDTH